MSTLQMNEVYSLATLTLPSGWQLQFPADYRPLLFPQGQVCLELSELLSHAESLKEASVFRREIAVNGFPVLMAVLKDQRKVLIGSRRLARELALLKSLSHTDLQASALRAHASQMSSLDVREFPSEWQWVTATQKLLNWEDKEQFREVDELAAEKLRMLVKHVQAYHPTLFERFSDWGLGLTAHFSLIRIHLLKFLALLPSLDHDKRGFEVKRNLCESLRRLLEDDARLRAKGVKVGGVRPLPRAYISALSLGLQAARFLPARLLATLVRAMVKKMAKRFIAGESIASSDKTLHSLHSTRREATLDQLGELVVSEDEADEYLKRVLAIIHGLKIHVQPGERNAAGINKAHVSIKVSALASDFKPQAFEFTYQLVAPRLKKILLEAKREQVFINVDAEHYHYRDLVLKIFRRVLLETSELHGWGDCGIVIQAYLRDGSQHLREVIALAQERKVRMPIRLVKGAYWDAETIESEAHSHHAPQFLNKEESDLHFRQLAALTLENAEHLQLAVGSHNLQDHCFVEALRTLKYPHSPVIEHQCLHMTYEALSHGIARMGWPTRNYMPIGNLLVGMAYLVRRIMENSSQVGILTIMRSHNKKEAFQTPLEVHQAKVAAGTIERDGLEARLDSGFRNATPLRLYLESERTAFESVLAKKAQELKAQQSEWQKSSHEKIICSSHPELIVGVVQNVSAAEGEQLAQAFYQGMKHGNGWTELLPVMRQGILLKAADLMWMRRSEFASHIVFEAGKTWGEALADVDEAIDFINYYVREDIRLREFDPELLCRGVTAVIAPWNFPLAIPCGMTVAPLITGNAVLLKPAEQTPLVASMLCDLLFEAGVPKTALRCLPGEGETLGAALVKHSAVAAIVFTGSKNVGQWIYRRAATEQVAHPLTGQRLPKKVITEMGGKNALIVTNNCEQDETVSGILYSAFGHAGQKCSACSRIIVDAEVKDSLLERLSRAIQDLEVGPATAPHVLINPLITAGDQARVKLAAKEAILEAQQFGGKVWVDRSQEDFGNFCVGPSLIELPYERSLHPDSWAQREVFGPVIHIITYHSLDEAVELFNSTEYALTGGIYGQSQDDIDYLLKRLKCGNLYVNRPNTGARVAIEPFGGFKLSGTGPKAGGRDYLSSFTLPSKLLEARTHQEPWSEGSGFSFEIPRSSGLSLASRLGRLTKLATLLNDRYETLSGGVSELDKSELQNFMKWIQESSASVIQQAQSNLKIPGQVSVDHKDLAKESLLIVAGGKHLHLVGILHFLSALTAGTGVSVTCTTNASYQIWKSVVDLAWQCGFAKANVEVYKVSRAELQEIFKNPGLCAVYLEGADDVRADLLSMALPTEAIKIYMRSIFHDGEHPPLGAWAAWLEQYLWVRSLAINTMRHGAPLELGL